MQINVQYGIDSVQRTVASGTTVGQVIADTSLKMVLGYGDNTKVVLNGVEQPATTPVVDGGHYMVEVRANQKAK